MTSNALLTSFAEALSRRDGRIFEDYQRSEAWTVAATGALVEACSSLIPGGRVAAKGFPDDWRRSEYMTLDLVVLPQSWAPPLLVAEHENSPYADRVRYDAWKLFSITADTRVLVAYFGGRREMATRADLERVVGEVAHDNPGRELILISADSREVPRSMEELHALYAASVITAPREGTR